MSARCSSLIAAVWLVALIAQPSLSLADSVVVFGGPCNIPINDPPGTGGAWTEAPLNISPDLTISDLDVRLSITHTMDYDLQLYLKSPSGTRTLLNMYDYYAFGANYTQTTFDDEAPMPIEQGMPPFTGSFRPKNPFLLSDFDGESTAGEWILQIYDGYAYNTGTLDSFELIVTTPEPSTAALLMFAAVLSRRAARRRKSRWVPPTPSMNHKPGI